MTAFEDFFSEQRPFFVEGASIFQTGDYDLLYSRRIGRRPGYFSVPEEAVEEGRPEATTILGALKLTGKTEGKTAFGLLQVVTVPEYADINRNSVRDEYRIEPLTNYLVGRVRQDVFDGTSGVGLFASSVHRCDGQSAYVGATDWDLRFREDIYNLTGTLAASRAGEPGDRHSGYIADVDLKSAAAGLRPRRGWPRFRLLSI